ncbi:MAG: M48 family metallopeptidase [Aphanocapsa sp. GSE-SYN-MK-11-07L]|nr:M48 family metallopeptidase [Aphanocapsa sp. GSE-SYN-MK-11-07L]
MLSPATKITLSAALSAILLQTALPTQAKPQTPQQQAQTAIFYQKAKKELPKDWYVVYRVIDRIARANGLDNSPWRAIVIPEYNINAFATDVNLIAIYSGIIDQLAGDSSAIACVVGHEMAHHTKRHIAVGKAEKAALIAQIEKEAEAEVVAEKKDAESDANQNSFGGAVLGTLGNVLGGWGNTVSNVGQSSLSNASKQRKAEAQKRIQEIVTLKKAELEQRLAESDRRQEFEADEMGYQYIARAGFEPEGCLRLMEVFARTPSAEFDTTHPAVPKRIERLKELMAKYPPLTLAQEGKLKISASQPLTYDLSQDGNSLRINSRRGGSAADDIDRRFKQ